MSKRRRSKPFESTIRPPPPAEDEQDQIEGLRPMSKAPADLEPLTLLDPQSFDGLFQAEPSRTLRKLLTPPADHPLEEVKVRRKRR